jgi:hypothetical protein
MNNLTSEELSKIYTNPYYCLNHIHEAWILPHKPDISEELWIRANVEHIKEIGAEKWLQLLLENLKGAGIKEG